MDAAQIRQKFLEFSKSNGHVIISRAKLVPQDDPTTLFTGSGMQPLVPYLLGQDHPQGVRLADSQTCLRAEDITEVGDNRHTTFFEMLGNWSLGDYWKKEQLEWFWQFMTKEIGLDPKKLYVTCFGGEPTENLAKDTESAEILQKLYSQAGITAEIADPESNSSTSWGERGIRGGERIFYYDASKNWWSRSGAPANMPVGEPGGPDSEVFYRFSDEHDKSFGANCHPNCDCGSFLEIGNSVFMEYLKTEAGFQPLPKKNVDFGGGLERISAASNDDPDVFKISLLWPIIVKLIELSGKTYESNATEMRAIADHLRAATWLAVDGITPSNKEQGYVLRKLIRRAVLKGHHLGIQHGLCEAVVPTIVSLYKNDFSEFAGSDSVVTLLSKEETVFRQTLVKGIKVFEKTVSKTIDGQTIFTLYDTFGFPTELSIEQAKLLEIKVDATWQTEFDKLMAQQRELSRTATTGQFKGGLGGHSDVHKMYHTATHLMYKALKMVLGDHVMQRGSNITEERLRFDFDHPQKMTPEEIKKVEEIVNEQMARGLDVSFSEMLTKDAQSKGALGAFGDKYGEKVKVYQMAKDGEVFSYEICGGPHVTNTHELAEGGKQFKILKEESSSAGIRRIKAALV